MFKELFNKFKQRNCEHSYEFVGENVTENELLCDKLNKEYVFKCKKCSHSIVLDKIDVIESFNEIYKKKLIEELEKPADCRCTNDELIDITWNTYNNDIEIKNILSKKYKGVTLSKELKEITEEDILHNTISVRYKNISRVKLSVNEVWDTLHVVYSHKKKLKFVNQYRLNYEIDKALQDEISSLVRKGIKYDYETVREDIVKRVYNDNKIMRL